MPCASIVDHRVIEGHRLRFTSPSPSGISRDHEIEVLKVGAQRFEAARYRYGNGRKGRGRPAPPDRESARAQSVPNNRILRLLPSRTAAPSDCGAGGAAHRTVGKLIFHTRVLSGPPILRSTVKISAPWRCLLRFPSPRRLALRLVGDRHEQQINHGGDRQVGQAPATWP